MKPFQSKGEVLYASPWMNALLIHFKNRTLLGICFLMLLSIQTYGQDDWQLAASKEGVEAHYRISTCNNESVVFLKFVNTTDQAVTISWHEEYLFTGEGDYIRVNPDGFELGIPTGEMEGTDCDNIIDLQLVSRPNLMLKAKHDDQVERGEIEQSDYQFKQIQAFKLLGLTIQN